MPATDAQLPETDLHLLVLAQKSQQVLAGEESTVLMEPTCSPSPTRRGVEPAEANAIIEQAGHFRQRASGHPIRRETVAQIAKVIEACRSAAT